MKKVLIVCNDVVLLSIFKRWATRSEKENVLFFAKNSKKAIEIINAQPIDLLISDLNLPEIDGIELAVGLSGYYPMLKTAFFIDKNAKTFNEQLTQLSSIYFINQPESLKEFVYLADLISVIDLQVKYMSDILTADFLKLIEYQKKTCLFVIENKTTQQKCALYFKEGVLCDAMCDQLKAEEAVLEILDWTQTKIVFKNATEKKFQQKIQTSLTALIKQKLTAQTNTHSVLLAKTVSPTIMEEITLPLIAQQLSEKVCALDVTQEIKPLQFINNYLAFVIFDSAGNLLVHHQEDPAFEKKLVQISFNMGIFINIITNTLANPQYNQVEFIQLHFDDAIFGATWLVEKQIFAAFLLTATAKNSGLAKIHLDKISQSIRHKLFDVALV